MGPTPRTRSEEDRLDATRDARLTELERRVARGNRATILLAGLLAATWGISAQGPIGTPEPKPIVASEFQLVDERGRVGARLGFTEEGFSIFSLSDPNGRVRAAIEVGPAWSDKEHRVGFALRNRDGAETVALGTLDNDHHGDSPWLKLGLGEAPFFSIEESLHGSPELEMLAGESRLRLGVDAITRKAYLHLWDLSESREGYAKHVLLLGKGGNDEPFGARLLTRNSEAALTAEGESPQLILRRGDKVTFDSRATDR